MLILLIYNGYIKTMAGEELENGCVLIDDNGKISGDELADFVAIQEQLEKISVAVETLQLWSERMLATGAIDPEQYRAYKESLQTTEG